MRRHVNGPTTRHASEYRSSVTCRDCGTEVCELAPAESIARRGQRPDRTVRGACPKCGRSFSLPIVRIP